MSPRRTTRSQRVRSGGGSLLLKVTGGDGSVLTAKGSSDVCPVPAPPESHCRVGG